MIKIKEELRNFISPLTTKERELLTANILQEGIKDPIVLWNGYIIDGHNRYDIATEHDIDFDVIHKEFDSEAKAKEWMVYNQISRRSLNLYSRIVLALKFDAVLEAEADLRMKHQGPEPNSAPQNAGRRREKLAEIANAGHGTIFSVKKILADNGATEEEKSCLIEGTKSINEVIKDIDKRNKQNDILDNLAPMDMDNIPDVFQLIYADPPWQYDFAESPNRDIENHYPTMNNTEIAEMNVPADENCVLYMWATAPKLKEAFEVIEGWGFTYKSCAVWDKEKIGMGYWFRGQHEILMVATKGKISPPGPNDRISSVIREARGKHSAKPIMVAEYLENTFPHLSKIELFSRKSREGWYSFGNQI